MTDEKFDVPKQPKDHCGAIWDGDHIRPLGWEEYQYWLNNPLPFNWNILIVPGEGAHVIEGHTTIELSINPLSITITG